jgi:hypothetical protein
MLVRWLFKCRPLQVALGSPTHERGRGPEERQGVAAMQMVAVAHGKVGEHLDCWGCIVGQ